MDIVIYIFVIILIYSGLYELLHRLDDRWHYELHNFGLSLVKVARSVISTQLDLTIYTKKPLMHSNAC